MICVQMLEVMNVFCLCGRLVHPCILKVLHITRKCMFGTEWAYLVMNAWLWFHIIKWFIANRRRSSRNCIRTIVFGQMIFLRNNDHFCGPTIRRLRRRIYFVTGFSMGPFNWLSWYSYHQVMYFIMWRVFTGPNTNIRDTTCMLMIY